MKKTELYKSAMDEIHAPDTLIKKLESLEKPARKLRFRAVGAIAACMAAVIIASAVFIIPSGNNSFTIKASAATMGEAAPDEAQAIGKNSFTPLGKLIPDGYTLMKAADEVTEGHITMESSLICEGENISEISYSIKGGKVDVPENAEILNRSDKHNKMYKNYGHSSNGVDYIFYDKATTSYENQVGDLCFTLFKKHTEADNGVLEKFHDYEMYAHLDDEFDISNYTANDIKKIAEDFFLLYLDDTEIRIDVKYKNGETDTAYLVLKPVVTVEKTECTDEDTGKTFDTYDYEVTIEAKMK